MSKSLSIFNGPNMSSERGRKLELSEHANSTQKGPSLNQLKVNDKTTVPPSAVHPKLKM